MLIRIFSYNLDDLIRLRCQFPCDISPSQRFYFIEQTFMINIVHNYNSFINLYATAFIYES